VHLHTSGRRNGRITEPRYFQVLPSVPHKCTIECNVVSGDSLPYEREENSATSVTCHPVGWHRPPIISIALTTR